MYSEKLAIAVKCDGKVLREFGDKVYLPFGSEYTLLIKNLHTQRAVVNISIDGTTATAQGLVVEPGKEFELERFIQSFEKGNRFKFIERTAEVSKHRGNKLEDGLVVVEFRYEAEPMLTAVAPDELPEWMYKRSPKLYKSAPASTTTSHTKGVMDWAPTMDRCCEREIKTSGGNLISTDCHNEVGITVPGSISEQKFHSVMIGKLEAQKHSMVIHLIGMTEDNQKVAAAVSVKAKPKCVTCGKTNKATASFLWGLRHFSDYCGLASGVGKPAGNHDSSSNPSPVRY